MRDGPSGVIAALVTPFRSGGGIDVAGVARLVEHAIAGGVHGLLVTGSAGEFVHLSRGERLLVTRAAVEAAARRVPVYAGTTAVSTEETIALTRDAAGAGADAAIVAAPYYFTLPPAALARHYREVALAGGLPLVVHNTPHASGNSLALAALLALADEPNIVGVIERGDDGLCSATAGIIPSQIVELYDACRAGERERAAAIQERLQPLLHHLEDASGGRPAACKAALTWLGLPAGPVRRPLPPLGAEETSAIRAALAGLGLAL